MILKVETGADPVGILSSRGGRRGVTNLPFNKRAMAVKTNDNKCNGFLPHKSLIDLITLLPLL